MDNKQLGTLFAVFYVVTSIFLWSWRPDVCSMADPADPSKKVLCPMRFVGCSLLLSAVLLACVHLVLNESLFGGSSSTMRLGMSGYRSY